MPKRYILKTLKSLFIGLVCILIFTGCGYRPVSHYAQGLFNDGVYVEIHINPAVPESGTGVKDVINNAVIKRFHSKLKSKQEAKSFIFVNVQSITQSPIAYNPQGFVSFYRTNVALTFEVKNNKGANFSISNTGFYDYSAEFSSTIVLDQYRLDSISQAASQALDKFISQVAYYGEFYKGKE